MIKLKKLNSVQNIRLEAVVSHILFFLINFAIIYFSAFLMPKSYYSFLDGKVSFALLFATLFSFILSIINFVDNDQYVNNNNKDQFRFNLNDLPWAIVSTYTTIFVLFLVQFVVKLVNDFQIDILYEFQNHFSKQALINASIGFVVVLITITIIVWILHGKPSQSN